MTDFQSASHSRKNHSRRKLTSGSSIYGAWMSTPAPALVEICGLVGFDYVLVDCEHSSVDLGTVEQMVRAAEAVGITPLVRVPGHDPSQILRYLDFGAQGVVVPHVNTVAQAEAVVSATRYPPLGRRGTPGAVRATRYGLGAPMPEYLTTENDEILVIAMLEEVAALDELDELVRVPGIDGFFIGPGDLSTSMGFPGEPFHPKVQAVKEQFVAAVLAADSVIGDTATTREAAAALVAQGYRMFDCSFEKFVGAQLKQLVTDVGGAIA